MVNDSSHFKATYLKLFLENYSNMFTDWSFPFIIFKLFFTVSKKKSEVNSTQRRQRNKNKRKNKRKNSYMAQYFLGKKNVRSCQAMPRPLMMTEQEPLHWYQWHLWVDHLNFSAVSQIWGLMSNNHMTSPSSLLTFAKESESILRVLYSKVPPSN